MFSWVTRSVRRSVSAGTVLWMGLTGSALIQLNGQVLYNGIALPQPFPPIQSATQAYQLPSYIGNPPAVIPIDVGRQLFVDDFLIQQSTLTRTQHQAIKYPLNPILKPNPAEDTGGFAMPFSDGVWYDPSDHLFKMWLFCGTGNAVCYTYSTDGINWIRPSIPDAMVPNSDQVIVASPGDAPLAGLIVWMDLQDPNPARKFKAFASDSSATALLYFSPDGIHWNGTIRSNYPIPMFDRTTYFWNPFRNVWVDSLKTYTSLPSAQNRPAYLSRSRLYTESTNLSSWNPAQPQPSGNFWTGPDVNDPPYFAGGTLPQLYNLDAVAYESVMVGLFNWFHPGFDDGNPDNLPGPDLVELGVGFSRDGFQWVRPTRGSGPGLNGAFLAASNTPGTWDLGNTQSAGGCFLVVGDELWFYFSGRNARHGDAPVTGATGLATLRRDGFYSMDAGSSPGVLTTRPVKFSGRYLFVNVKDPQGSLQVQVLNPSNGAVLATSQPLSADKTLQPVAWANGLADLSAFANQPVQFQFTLTNGSLYSFWVSATTSGASNGYVAGNGPGFSGVTDNLGIGAYPTTVATPQFYPPGGIVASSTNITILTRTAGAAIHYTLDGSTPNASSPLYTGPLQLPANATITAIALSSGLTNSALSSASYTVDNTPPSVSITTPANNQVISATASISVNSSDNIVGVASVQFFVDGTQFATLTSPPYTAPLQTTTLTNASHQITAVATNNLGIQATSAPVAVTVQNTTSGPLAGLAGYWSFDSAYISGATVFDQSGNNNNVTANNTNPVAGQIGQALQFNGASAYLQVPSSLSTQAFDLVGDLSLSLWIQTTNATRYEALISKYAAGGSGHGYLLQTTPGGTVWLVLGVANIVSGNSVAADVTKINDGRWHHLAVVTRLGVSVAFYVDGALSSIQTISSVAGTAQAYLQMGFNPNPTYGSNFTGSMDEVRVYNRALSGAEAAALYGGTGSGQPPTATATFVKADTATQGNWRSAYGQSGYVIANDSTSLPSYAAATFNGASLYTWAPSTLDPRALVKSANPSDSIAAAYYAAGSFTIDLNISSGQPCPVAFYALDWDYVNRTETISILDAGTSQLLDSRLITGFAAGEYLVWNLSGHVTIQIASSAGPNAVLNGIFFGAGLSPDLTIAKTHSGVFSQGDTGDQYTIAVSNAGNAASSGTVTVTETVPSGLTAVGIGGAGWNCTQPAGPCTRADALAPSTSYPAITLTVNVAANAPGKVTNTASVSGGGDANTSNNTANDPTNIASGGTPFVTAFALNGPRLRNDFTGWVGMSLTVGATPLTVSALGRVCIAGNSGAHTIKFVTASTGTDVQGGSVSLNMAGCAAGQFSYGALATPITLQANTTYYLTSQELTGGDQWYDFGALTTTSAAAVNSSLYSPDGQSWFPVSTVNTSYVPPGFLYSLASSTPIAVTVQSNIAGPSFSVDGTTYSSSQTFNWTAGTSHSLAAATPQTAGAGSQYAWTGWSDGGALSHSITPVSSGSFTASFVAQYLLNSSVTPANGGSIALNPSGASGYFANGTSVQLTATPGAGCSFTGWSGDLTGAANPQSLTMSAPHSINANFQCSTATSSFVKGYAQNTLRNDFTGWAGMTLTVGSAPLSVSSLGRICAPGNAGNHVVKLVNGTTYGTDLPGGSTLVNMSRCVAGQFVYSNLSSPVTLQAGASYHVVSAETTGGDQWYEYGPISVTSDATVKNAVFSPDSATWITVGGASLSYVPPNFQYSMAVLGSPDLAISKSHSGIFTQGDNGDTYTIGVTNVGNAGTNGTVQVSEALPPGLTATGMSGPGWNCTQPAGPCSRSDTLAVNGAYSPIAVTVNVASNAPASVTNTATVSVTGDSNMANNTANDPTSIQARVAITIQPGIAGVSFSVDGTVYTSTQVFNWISGSSHTVATSTPQSGGTGVQYVFTGWSDGGNATHTISPASSLTLTAGFVVQYLLTTVAAPSVGGAIALTPASSGYYNNGTQVQLTATPNPGYIFLNWSGDLSGSANPQPLNMSAPYSVTANFQQLIAGVTGYTQTATLRNNFGSFAGMTIAVGSSSLSVATLGRVCAPGNVGTHTIKLVDANSGADLPGGSVTVNMAGCTPGQFVYGQLPTPITLQAYSWYLLASLEALGGDQWYDFGPISTTSDLAVTSSVYFDGTSWRQVNAAGTSYVPPGFQYYISAAAGPNPTVIAAGAKGPGRNNFTGWVGTSLTVGPAGLKVSSLGRMVVSGNSGTHVVKLVRASDGSNVPGASVSVPTAAGVPGQFAWAALATPVTLPANTSYYLVSSELLGADQWYDLGTVSTTNTVTINSAIYSVDGQTWIPAGGPNMSYVPPNLK